MQNLRTSNDFIHNIGFFGFLIAMSVLGIFFGVMSFCFMDDSFLSQISLAQQNFMEIRKNQDFVHILIKSLCSSTVFLGCAFVLGFSAIAQPLEILIPLIRGLGLGVSVAQIYSQSGRSGIITCGVIILPCAVISMYALVVGVRESVGLSNIFMSNALCSGQTTGLLDAVKLYATKFLVLEAVVAVSAVIDCVCTVAFVNRF